MRRQIAILFEHDIALYSAHLPLDVHPLVGNNAQLAAALGLTETEPFFEDKDQLIGLRAKLQIFPNELARKLEHSLGSSVKLFACGPADDIESELSPAARAPKFTRSPAKASILSSPAKRRIGRRSRPKNLASISC